MTTKGQFIEQAAASTTAVDIDGGGANPPLGPETAEEESAWQQASPWVHGILGVVSFVPGLSVVSGGIDAAIYAGEGNLMEAGIAAASMIPGGKVVTTAGKIVKGAATMAKGAGKAAKVAKAAHEAEEVAKAAKLAKEAADARKVAKGAENATETVAGSAKATKNTTIKGRKKGPCDHLRQGSGKGPYRGGAHGKTKKPTNDGKDSHHMPSKHSSSLDENDGPAIQMEINDHKKTASNGNQGPEGIAYRRKIAELLNNKKWREAMLTEIKNIQSIARDSGDPRKYNEAMLEMLEYFKCLEKK